MSLSLRSLLLAAFCAVLFLGCGNSQDSLGVANAGPNVPGFGIFGRVLLEQPATGATVQITDISGNPLGFPSGQINSAGNFELPVLLSSLPAEFRIRVDLPPGSPWDLPLLANVTRGEAAFCNIPTTAAALYRERTGASQVEAEAWARRTFGIPPGAMLGSGVDESTRSFFRHGDFLERARTRGGAKAYLSELLDSPVSGQFGDVVGAIALNIGLDLAADVVLDALGGLAQAFGFNVGNEEEVQEALDELSSIVSSLSDLETQISNDFATLQTELADVDEATTLLEVYDDLTQALETPVAALDERTEALIILGQTNSITNEPRLPLEGFDAFATSLANFNSEATLALLSDILLGGQELGLLEVYQRLLLLDVGVDPAGPTVFANTPCLSNTLNFDRYESVAAYYVNAQLLGLNLLVENANLSLSPSIVADARISVAKFRNDLILEGQAVGIPLPSDSLFSLPGNAFQQKTSVPVPSSPSATIYYRQIQPAIFQAYAAQDSTRLVNSFQAPGYPAGWRLPSRDELDALRAIALQQNPSDPLAGLRSLGFTNFPTNWTGSLNFLATNSENLPEPGVYLFLSGEIISGVPGPESPYIMVNSQGFDSTASFAQLVAAGFRPTGPISLQLNGDSTAVQAFLGDENITNYCTFRSSAPRQLELVNTGQDALELLWHPGEGPLSSQTVTATMAGMNATDGSPRELRATLNIAVPSPAPTRSVTRIQVLPSNTVLIDSTAQTPFKAIAFYDDRTIADVSGEVAWSLELPNGLPYPPSEATINGTIPGILIFTQTPVAQPTVVIRATLDSVAGTTQLEVSEATP